MRRKLANVRKDIKAVRSKVAIAFLFLILWQKKQKTELRDINSEFREKKSELLNINSELRETKSKL